LYGFKKVFYLVYVLLSPISELIINFLFNVLPTTIIVEGKKLTKVK